MAITIAGSGIVSANIADNQNLGIENFVPRGLICSNDTDASHDVAISVGGVRDATNTVNMSLAAILTKRIDAAWAVGDNNGGLDGTESSGGTPDASTMYYIWLIERSDTGVVDALYSESATGPTLPTNYDYKRLIGAVRTDGSANIINFLHHGGDTFTYLTGVVDVADSSMTDDAGETGTLSVPPLASAYITGGIFNTGETGTSTFRLQIRTKGSDWSLIAQNIMWLQTQISGTSKQSYGRSLIPTDSNSQVEYATNESAGTANVELMTLGFIMHTRSNP